MQSTTYQTYLDNIINFCGSKFKQPEDIERLIKLCLKNNKKNLFEETAFYSKYLHGLLSIIRRGETSINEEVFIRYRNEYLQNIEKIKDNLNNIIADSDQFFKQIFTGKYLDMTEKSVNNLTELIHDLSWIKMYLNSARKR